MDETKVQRGREREREREDGETPDTRMCGSRAASQNLGKTQEGRFPRGETPENIRPTRLAVPHPVKWGGSDSSARSP